MTQTQSFDARVPANVPVSIAAILTAALKDIGIRETKGLANRGPQVDRFQPAHIRDRAGVEGVPWCASAVCTWWHDGLGTRPFGKMIRSADGIKDAAKMHGLWNTAPRPGDAFVLLHGADTPGFDKGHTGLVLRVSHDGSEFQAIEGNARNACRLIQRKTSSVLGFASPIDDAAWHGMAFERGLISGAETPGGSTR